MNFSKLILAPLVLSIIAAPAFADKPDRGDKPKGKPFKKLRALIEANTDLINANAASIDSLNSEIADLTAEVTASIDSLNGEVAELTAELTITQESIAALTTRVSNNESEIAALLLRVAEGEEDLTELETELSNAIAATLQLRADLEADIALLNTNLRALITTNSGLIAQLNTLIADLQVEVGNNTASINAITTQVAGLLTTVISNTNNITLIQTESAQLTTNVEDLTVTVNTLVTEVEVVKDRIASLEALYSGIEENIADTADLVVGTSKSGSLQLSDDRSQIKTCTIASSNGRGSINTDCYADYYTLYIAEEATVTIEVGSPDLDAANYGTGNFFDTYLILHNENDLAGSIAEDDDSGNALNSQITTTLQPGLYIVEVTASNIYNSGINDYQLRVQ